MYKYKNYGKSTKVFYGVTFQPGAEAEVSGYINDPDLIRVFDAEIEEARQVVFTKAFWITFAQFGDPDVIYSRVLCAKGSEVPLPPDPVKPPDADYAYLFNQWIPNVVPVTEETTYLAIFYQISDLENTSWSAIRAVSDKGLASSYWDIGDTKSLEMSATGQIGEHTLSDLDGLYAYIIGFDHNIEKEADGYDHSITFGTFMSDKVPGGTLVGAALYDTCCNSVGTEGDIWFYMNSTATNAGGWAQSVMRQNVLGSQSATDPESNSVMALLPTTLRSYMKPIKKTDGETTVTDYLPLLSAYEVFGTGPDSDVQEQYAYYVGGSITSKVYRWKYNYLEPVSKWWLRTSISLMAGKFYVADSSGAAVMADANYSYGCCPIFAI